MSNISIENNDVGSVILVDSWSEDDLLTFAGAGTVVEATILARSTASAKLIPYVKGGSTDGNGIPVAIITYDVTATGAGDISVRAAISGKYRTERLVIDADGDATNVDKVVTDLLRDKSLIPISVTELNILDNQ